MNSRSISAIVALDNNNAIGRQGDLLCHLPADLKHFKSITMNHTIIMGRKTFESFPKGALPGRQNIVITRSANYQAPGIHVVHNLSEALKAADMPGEVFIIGGAQIYRLAMPVVTRLYLTRIDAAFADADTFFPTINPKEWKEVEREHHQADERNPYPYTFITLERVP